MQEKVEAIFKRYITVYTQSQIQEIVAFFNLMQEELEEAQDAFEYLESYYDFSDDPLVEDDRECARQEIEGFEYRLDKITDNILEAYKKTSILTKTKFSEHFQTYFNKIKSDLLEEAKDKVRGEKYKSDLGLGEEELEKSLLNLLEESLRDYTQPSRDLQASFSFEGA